MIDGLNKQDHAVSVLVVDDEAIIRDNLALFLEDENYRVMTAASAEQALKVLDSRSADVAIVDIRLSGQDGNSLILSAHRQRPDLKFLIHTGSLEYVLPNELRVLGLSERHVLRKPMGNMGILVEAIEALVRSAS